MSGIVAYGTYVPYFRLRRDAISAALGAGGGKGSRAVASYDEDTTSLGVEAARRARRMPAGTAAPGAVYFATSSPAYLEKTNAAAVHAALGLPVRTAAYDMVGSVRSGLGALRAAHDAASTRRDPGGVLAVLSDIRTGLPGGGDESGGGDAAAAFVVGGEETGAPLAEIEAWVCATGEFLDRWRLPSETAAHVWEERFGEQAYVPLAAGAIEEALHEAGIEAAELARLIVTGTHGRAARAVAQRVGAKPDALVDDQTSLIGNTGTAHAGLLLAHVLDQGTAAEGAPSLHAGDAVAVVSLADGVDVVVLRVTEALARYQPATTVAAQIAGGNDSLPYATFLTWRGQLTREPPRRPDPERPAAPPAFRRESWKFGFVGSRCQACGARHLPPQRVCVKCHAVDQMAPEALADVPATIATFTVDRLAFSLSPPVVAAVIDFDGGGRFQCELTDVDPATVRIGDRVEMTFRRLFTAGAVHNYFWKARPQRGAVTVEEA